MSNINWMAVALLFVSNMIMLYAWYGHLKSMESSPVWAVVLVSWGIAEPGTAQDRAGGGRTHRVRAVLGPGHAPAGQLELRGRVRMHLPCGLLHILQVSGSVRTVTDLKFK